MEIGWEQKVYPTAKIALVVKALAEEGVDARAALRGAELSLEQMRSPTVLVCMDQVLASYRNALRLTQNPNFAFEMGLKSHVSLYGMYGFAILSSMDFRETMHFATRYHRLATPLVKMHFTEEPRSAVWTFEPLPHPAMDERLYKFIVDCQLGVHLSLHRDIMGADFTPTAVHLTYGAPKPESRSPFGFPVAYTQSANRLFFDPGWLTGRPHLGDEIAYSTVLALCDDLQDKLQHKIGVAGGVRTYLLANLGRNVSLEDVAEHLGAPERTLRRKLRDENTSFREILDELRCEVAMKYLRETEMTVDDVAYALGFSETSNFRHAFRRWKQASPQQYRRQQRTDELASV
jgi:AraC-like DNA-binding protein